MNPAASHPRYLPKHYVLRLGVLLMSAFPVLGQVLIFNQTPASPVDVPDNYSTGTVLSQDINGILFAIESVRVHLKINSNEPDPMYNGDFYVGLIHNSTHVVLINRVGRRSGSSSGYGDGGFDVDFSDNAPADIHNYRVTLTGNNLVPLASGDTPGILTGNWQPDGRTADPSSVLATSARNSSLAQFAGGDPNGTWSLFVADLSPGATGAIVSWSITISLVPEPQAIGLMTGLGLVGFSIWRRRSRVISGPPTTSTWQ